MLLNPSTADEHREDPTVRRCMGYARRWGARELRVVNVFAYRATTPADMLGLGDEVGPLEEGKRANLLVLSGAPFQPGTKIDAVLLDGEFVIGDIDQ